MQHTKSCVGRRSVAMKQRTRIYYSDSQKALMWERWKAGDSLQQIAQLFDRSHSSVEGILSRTGGIPPPERCRASLALTLAEREEISRAVVAGFPVRAIASILGRAPSTVSREIKRNGGRQGYRAAQADQAAWDRGAASQEMQTCKEQSLGAHCGCQAPIAVGARADRGVAQA
jgi:IS30 family transposase